MNKNFIKNPNELNKQLINKITKYLKQIKYFNLDFDGDVEDKMLRHVDQKLWDIIDFDAFDYNYCDLDKYLDLSESILYKRFDFKYSKILKYLDGDLTKIFNFDAEKIKNEFMYNLHWEERDKLLGISNFDKEIEKRYSVKLNNISQFEINDLMKYLKNVNYNVVNNLKYKLEFK